MATNVTIRWLPIQPDTKMWYSLPMDYASLTLEQVDAGPRRDWQPVLAHWTELRLPTSFTASWTGSVRATLVCTYNGLRYDLERLELRRAAEGGEPITSRALKTLKPIELVHASAQAAVRWRGAPSLFGPARTQSLKEGAAQAKAESRSPALKTLTLVAAAHRYGEAIGVPPVELVRDIWDVSPSTVGNWVRQARAAGLMEPFVAVEGLVPGIPAFHAKDE